MSARVVLMTKVPIAGQVKTRLIPALGPQGAADLHAAMVLDTFAHVKSAGLQCTASIAGDLTHPIVGALADLGATIEVQKGADLGVRLEHALRGPQRAIAVGTDCVCFSPEWLVQAADSAAPVSLGPAEDGGYWAIAVSPEARPVVFKGIDWSTDAVHRQTLTRAASAHLVVHRLPECYDIDRPEDLVRLRADPRCPKGTASVLEALLG